MKAYIKGISYYLPETILTNEQLVEQFPEWTVEKISKKVGISERHVTTNDKTAGDMAIKAAEKLIAEYNIDRSSIDFLLLCTQSPDYHLPSTSCIIQDKLGLSIKCGAVDFKLRCSGYAYGLYMASTFVKATEKKVLLLDGDIQSAYMSKYDKSTVPVMADAGSATLLSPSKEDNEWKFTFYTDGSGRNNLIIPAAGSASPIQASDLEYQTFEDGGKRRNTDIYMDGFEIFRFVASDISKWLQRFLAEANESAETIDSFVPHQANMYMIKKLARKLKIDWENTWQSGDAVGNSASATVPVTIAFDVENRINKEKNNRVLISGFGGGLSASAGIITLDPKAYYKFFQYQGKNE